LSQEQTKAVIWEYVFPLALTALSSADFRSGRASPLELILLGIFDGDFGDTGEVAELGEEG
jgi:hypothetical protein